ncbi:MAG: 2-oxoglutarate dehydrogenase complex dihydrolipoyllysine-residue succinyltransferase [Bacteroidales bacterium]|nr:2-oxoglutarate dehydrogenase complex dihydrolipoyllysine-residue succinyltransferase [Bacteroidales bacterium]
MIEIKVPSPGESITQVQIARWLVNDGDPVEKDQEIVEIDSDKATFPVAAPDDGTLTITVAEGETVDVGAVIATIIVGKADKPTSGQADKRTSGQADESTTAPQHHGTTTPTPLHATPLAKKIIEEKKIDSAALTSAFPGKKVTRKEIESFLKGRKEEKGEFIFSGDRTETRKKLSTLRLKLAERLVAVRNETAMLTTFNEINMRKVLEIKELHSDRFKEKYGVGIGLMSFFTKAVTLALQEFPVVNSMISGEELVIPNYVDMGIAVSAPKGLLVPVIRNTESLSLAEIEIKIKEMAVKARENRITIDDMKGGSFTISNGGVYGSLMSTPILNPPQSGILGMHKIMDRPVAVNGQMEIHPMMYIALSYDHRLIDGRESVGFLVRVKELVEEPGRMLTGGEDLYRVLLDI